jgi:hypothetical protein
VRHSFLGSGFYFAELLKANPEQTQIFGKSPAKQGFYQKSGFGLFAICCNTREIV